MKVKVYHLTTQKNLDSILREGILSRTKVRELHPDFNDIASPGALSNHMDVKIENLPIEQYARFFFNPLPPMYYNRENEPDVEDLCIVELHIPFEEKLSSDKSTSFHNLFIKDVKWEHIAMFRKSIAGYMKSNPGADPQDIRVRNLNYIRWDSRPEAWEKNNDEAIANRGAELLVHPFISAEYIHCVYSDGGNNSYLPISSLKPARDAGAPTLIES